MNSRMRKVCTVCAAVLVSLWAAAAAFGDDAPKPVLKVNDMAFNNFQLREALNQLVPAASFHGEMSEETRARYRPKAIDLLIESALFYQEARRLGIKADDDKVDEAEKKVMERVGGRKGFFAALKGEGMTEDDFRENLRRKLTVEIFEDKEIKAKSEVTDDEVKADYERNRESYMRPESRKLSHILVSVDPSSNAEQVKEREKRAQEALDKLKAGEDFATLAWDYSDDPFRVKGGDLGVVHMGRLDPDLDKVAFSLKLGETSGLVHTMYGFHIIRVEQIFEPTQLTLEDVAKGIKSRMEADRLKTLRESILKRLKETAVIEVY